MRKILLLIAGLLPLLVSAQVTIVSDDFEGLTDRELCAANSDLWTTWSGGLDAEDAYVSDAYAISGSNSVNIAGYNGPTDLVLPFPETYTSGVYEFSMKAYITAGNGGYFNIQATLDPIGTAWMFEILFDGVGGGFINAGGNNAATVTYTPDQWMSLNVRADLDNDIGEFYMDSHLIYTWQWSKGATGTSDLKEIGGVDIFSYSADGSQSNMFVDNVLLEQIVTTGLFVEDFEKNVPDQLLAANNDTWTTWSGGIDGEDAYVSDLHSNSGFNSVNIDETVNLSDLVLPFPQDYTTGIIDFSFKMYMPSGFGGYFNVQQSSVVGLGFMLEVYFNDDGTGYINAGGANAATFTYTPDAWNDIWVKADLNTDMGEFLVNSGSIYQWQWTLGSDGSGAEKSIGGIDFYATSGSGTSNYYVDDVLLAEGFGVGVNNQTIHPDVFISPNPSNGQFSVMISDLSAGTYQCQVVDALGRVMSDETMNVSGSVKKNFDLNLSKGIYFVKLSDGNQTTTKKVVIN